MNKTVALMLGLGVAIGVGAFAWINGARDQSATPSVGANSFSSFGVSALDRCVELTRHELDDRGAEFVVALDIDPQEAVEVCEKAAAKQPSSASAHEHLARAYVAAARNSASSLQFLQKAADSALAAERLGSVQALLILSNLSSVPAVKLTGAPAGVDPTAPEQRLEMSRGYEERATRALQDMAAKGNAGAKVSLAALAYDRMLRGENEPYKEAEKLLQESSREGYAAALHRWFVSRSRAGLCISEEDPMKLGLAELQRQDLQRQFCNALVFAAADSGEPRSNLVLARSYLREAENYAKFSGGEWGPEVKTSVQNGRQRLLVVQQAGDAEFQTEVGQLLNRLDSIETSEEQMLSILVASLAVLAAMDLGDNGGTTGPQAPAERNVYREVCQQNQSAAAWAGTAIPICF